MPDNDRFDILFAAVREACAAPVWSRGVELSRAGAVVREPGDGADTVFRVALRGGMHSRVVTFFADDDDWECDCGSPVAGCEHVAAAIIAWRRAREAGDEGPGPGKRKGRVGYRFTRDARGLALERVIEVGETTHVLETTLAALAAGRVAGPEFVAAQHDLEAELALGTHRRGPLPRAVVPELFRHLVRCTDVRLDGRPVSVSAEPLLPLVRLEDQGEGFRLSVGDDPRLEETFKNGIARCGDTLHPIGQSRLSGRERHELPRGVYYGPDRLAELVTEVLPSLHRRVPVDVRTRRLPETSTERPRVVVETRRRGETLSVMATLVYGDPPRARIDGGRLVHLGGPIPLRDLATEKRLLRGLAARLDLAPGVRAEFEGPAAVAFSDRLERWDGPLDGRGHEHFALGAPLVPAVRVEGDDFDLRFTSGKRGPGADPEVVLRAFQRGEALVPLLGGGYAAIPQDWLERYGNQVADLLAARETAGKVPPSSLPDLARLCDDLELPRPPGFDKLRGLLDGFAGIPPVPLPADLTATLRGYQRAGADWLVFMRDAGLGAMLADDMGLGKTLQALCAIDGRTLVVAPTSVLHNWAEELRRFRPALTVNLYHGPRRALDPASAVTLTTYALLRLDVDALVAERWDTVVLDEAQAIKNPDSQIAAAAYRLQAPFRLTLTGTPVENRLDELWSQFHFINPGLLGGRRDFQERYAAPTVEGRPGAAARLRQRIRPFILRRLKKDVAPELPPRTEVVLRCELAGIEREVYDTIRLATLNDVVRRLEAGSGVMEALEALLRLRQAACHPALIPGREAPGSSKLDLLLDSLDSVVAEEHKALVFSQWTSLLDLCEPHLRRAGLSFLRLDGATRDRAGVVAGFQDPAGPPILLISLKAGGTGLNLTAADHVFLLDPWWNPAVEDQAADRAHRIGQDRPVSVYRLVAEETVEERILLLQQRKREIASAALEGADRSSSLTRDDLLDLLR